ncbi:MAG: DUF3365 domain-containing protein, partial [Draconibacterium sp.]|nr:DUF3365 domain-containing protein [Draconibacterium sp.]
MKRSYLILILCFWGVLIAASLFWNIHLTRSNNHKVVLNKSRAFFEQILVARAWNSFHGGVYVPLTAHTQPNIYLTDSLRDIKAGELELTMINPAYMTRQIAEINENNDLKFHITSLKPIRPGNIADQWESKALEAFEIGLPEMLEKMNIDGHLHYRYMAPLITAESCLKCHAKQGYAENDIRGGISVSFPSFLYDEVV